jgi:GxxExxY protein
MPVKTCIPIRRLSQPEFGEISFEVMRHVFAIHNDLGRFFDEKIYKRELAHRMLDVRLEEPIEIVFGTFRKPLFIDVLVGDGAIFEFKAVESLIGRHRSQLLQYLMLVDVAHGKLINIRSEDIEHEFVNAHRKLSDRTTFEVIARAWNSALPGTDQLCEFFWDSFSISGPDSIFRFTRKQLSIALAERTRWTRKLTSASTAI